MSDRTRNPAEKRKGQLTGETARSEASRLAREDRRARTAAAPAPKKRHMAGRMKGRGTHGMGGSKGR